uniref:cytochrome c biogenesis protein CcdA n=1 Tax=Roseovarius indicus TaxID=540747 RepID=UPI003513FD12
LVFGLAMTTPFMIAALFIGPCLRFASKFRRHLPKVEKAMGLLLIVFAVLIATDSVNYIAEWMLDAFPAFQNI